MIAKQEHLLISLFFSFSSTITFIFPFALYVHQFIYQLLAFSFFIIPILQFSVIFHLNHYHIFASTSHQQFIYSKLQVSLKFHLNFQFLTYFNTNQVSYKKIVFFILFRLLLKHHPSSILNQILICIKYRFVLNIDLYQILIIAVTEVDEIVLMQGLIEQIDQKPLCGKYLIRLKLKTGGFATVYLARDINDNRKQYAIKIIGQKYKRYAEMEQSMYQLIEKHKYTHGFVKNYQFGRYKDQIFLVMELVGQDLQQIMQKTINNRLSIKTSLMIGLQVIDRIEALHRIGYIHRDIKPQNLLIGLNDKNKVIYLIDFGLAKETKEIIKGEKGKAVGTLGYMSCNAHLGVSECLSDDIQSLIYTLIYLMNGTLPWMKIHIKTPQDIYKVKIMKQNIKKQLKNSQVPKNLFQILQYIRSLGKDEVPDYLRIKYKILQALKQLNYQNDFIFDWCLNKNNKKNTKQSKQEKYAQDNQNIIQNQIFQVFNFIKHQNPLDVQLPTKRTKQQQNIKDQQHKIQKLQKVQKVQKLQKLQKVERQGLIRPASVNNKGNKPKMNQLINYLENFSNNRFEGPKIVINKTAKHKI